MMRDDKLRSTGSFAHPILAGTVGATLLPLFVGLWLTEKRRRMLAILGIVAATLMTVTSNSSTPLLAYVAGVFGLCLWPIRSWLRMMRWGLVLTLTFLHMIMKGPVWSLIARIDLVGGSSADHRYQLVNQCILHSSEWWLVGVRNNGQWGWDMWDTANQYVATAQSSGPPPVHPVHFHSGLRVQIRRPLVARRGGQPAEVLMFWSMGGVLFAHVVGFFGITYFDQTIVVWYSVLAMVSAGYVFARRPQAAPATAVRKASDGFPQAEAPEPLWSAVQ